MTQRPIRLFLTAALWLVLAVAASFGIGFAIGFGPAFLAGLRHQPVPHRAVSALIGPLSAAALQATLLLGAWSRSRPPRGAGLGAGPIQRPALLATLAIGQLFATFAWAFLVVRLFGTPSTAIATLLRQSAQSGPWLLGALVVLATVMAPICEELFFRGWLWTALRRHWSPVPTAIATASPWLLLHIADGGWRRVLVLIPAAILFSVGRHYCGSVRASITMHIVNNGSVAALVAIVALFGS